MDNAKDVLAWLRKQAPEFEAHKKVKGIRHKRLPPLLQVIPMDKLRLTDWRKNELPEALWLAVKLLPLSSSSMRSAITGLEVMNSFLASHASKDEVVPFLKGWLSEFDEVPLAQRKPLVDHLRAAGLYQLVVPLEFHVLLFLYPDMPGRWLLHDDDTLTGSDIQRGLSTLGEILIKFDDRREIYAVSAFAVILSVQVKAHKFMHYPSPDGDELLTHDHIALLNKLPNLQGEELEELAFRLGLIVRLSFQMLEHSSWSESFWSRNWELFPCATMYTIEEENMTTTESGENSVSKEEFDELTERYRLAMDRDETPIREMLHYERQVLLLQERFGTLADSLNPHRVGVDRWEALSGLVYKSIRIGLQGIVSPAFGYIEHASLTLRPVLEARIQMKYLLLKEEQGNSMYSGYKEHGRSKAKQVKMFYQDLLDSLDREPTEVEMSRMAELAVLANVEIDEQYQPIQPTSTFDGDAALSTMAKEVGLKLEYEFYYTYLGTFSHNNWFAVRQTSMRPCLSPFHAGHLALNTSGLVREERDLQNQELLLEWLADLVQDYEDAFSVDREDAYLKEE